MIDAYCYYTDSGPTKMWLRARKFREGHAVATKEEDKQIKQKVLVLKIQGVR